MTKLFRLREKMKERSLDAIFIHNEQNQLYLTDFAFSDGLLLITLEKAFLITDFRYYEAALESANKDFTVVQPKKRKEFIEGELILAKIVKAGFEDGHLSYADYKGLSSSFPSVIFEGIGDTLTVMRQIKTAAEIKKIQAAQDIADKAYSHLLNMLTPGMTEREVALEIDYAMRKFGADGSAFETIAVSGDASAIPHGTPRNVKLKNGFLTVDFGARLNGYLSDMTRTVVIGKASEEMKRLYNTVLSAQLAALDFLREGVDCGEADKVARDIIDAVPEYKGSFGHSLGHSIGLLVHESPSLSPRSFGTRLKCGMISSVEPGIYLFGKYGCRIEDLVAIEEEGIHNFTKSTKELIEIY